MLNSVERRQKRQELRGKPISMIIKMQIKIAWYNTFMFNFNHAAIFTKIGKLQGHLSLSTDGDKCAMVNLGGGIN